MITPFGSFQSGIVSPARLVDVDGWALFLDLDGTLAPIKARPGDIHPDKRRTRLVRRLVNTFKGRLAIISGRSISDIDRILERAVVAVAGVHGLQRRSAGGDRIDVPGDPALDDVRTVITELTWGQPGIILEDKGASIALHYRGTPDGGGRVKALCKYLSEKHALLLQEGHMVCELRTKGPDKGRAIRAFMSERPFAGSKPIFIGDDLTDECGFNDVANMEGIGILVGANRSTNASRRLADVASVLNWLDTIGE